MPRASRFPLLGRVRGDDATGWFCDVLSERSPRRCIPVRLCDIPENVRMSAARRVCKYESDPDERFAVIVAAVAPSDRVYFVAPPEAAA